jgi:hypothetical protein
MDAGDFLAEGAETYRERAAAYGDNWRRVGPVMAALRPQGFDLKTEEDHNRFHILMLAIVKVTRYVENWDKGGHEDSTLDLSVYAAMLHAIDAEINAPNVDF